MPSSLTTTSRCRAWAPVHWNDSCPLSSVVGTGTGAPAGSIRTNARAWWMSFNGSGGHDQPSKRPSAAIHAGSDAVVADRAPMPARAEASASTDSRSERSLASTASALKRLPFNTPVVFIENLLAPSGPVLGVRPDEEILVSD